MFMDILNWLRIGEKTFSKGAQSSIYMQNFERKLIGLVFCLLLADRMEGLDFMHVIQSKTSN